MFENIKHIDELGFEYWLARAATNGSNYYVLDHFALKDKMVNIGSNTTRKIQDYKLSRYACYLITQNGDSRKKTVAID